MSLPVLQSIIASLGRSMAVCLSLSVYLLLCLFIAIVACNCLCSTSWLPADIQSELNTVGKTHNWLLHIIPRITHFVNFTITRYRRRHLRAVSLLIPATPENVSVPATTASITLIRAYSVVVLKWLHSAPR